MGNSAQPENIMALPKKISRKEGYGLRQGIPTDPESVKKATDEVMASTTVGVKVMSIVLGIGRKAGQDEARKGSFGAFKIAGQYRIPTAPLREVLQLALVPLSTDHVDCNNTPISANHSNAS